MAEREADPRHGPKPPAYVTAAQCPDKLTFGPTVSSTIRRRAWPPGSVGLQHRRMGSRRVTRRQAR